MGLDPQNPGSDDLIDQIKISEETESSEDDEDDEGSNSELEVTSDMDIFDIIKMAEEKEAK